ncbi:FAD-binding oxidoreductase, partial [archaeon]
MQALVRLNKHQGVNWRIVSAAAAASLIVSFPEKNHADCEKDQQLEGSCGVYFSSGETIMNWSGTHSYQPGKLYEPKNAQEVLRLLRFLHDCKIPARPVGTALSPNGVSLNSKNAISLSALDYIEVDPKSMLVTVGAGARVSDVLKELERYDLTISNFSSITEQQIGGWTQVAAHGTGATLPTVEEMIVRMKLATPTEGLLTLQCHPTSTSIPTSTLPSP